MAGVRMSDQPDISALPRQRTLEEKVDYLILQFALLSGRIDQLERRLNQVVDPLENR